MGNMKSLFNWGEYASDGTVTLSGSTGCMPASTNLTSKHYSVGHFREIVIHTKCTTDVATPMAFTVEIAGISEGGTADWKGSVVTFTSLDTGVEEWKDITDKGIRFLRVKLNNTNGSPATVLVVITCKA